MVDDSKPIGTDLQPHFWDDTRVSIETPMVPRRFTRMHAPMGCRLVIRMSDANQFLATELSWPEVRRLHQELTRVLKDRDRYEKAFAKKVQP